MSKSVAYESNEGHDSRLMGGKGGGKDEGSDIEERILEASSTATSSTLTAVFTVPATTDQFMHTPVFRRQFVDFVHVETLMVLRFATKGWNTAADAKIDEGVRSGELMVHDGKDISQWVVESRKERHKLAARAIFLLNITDIGEYACCDAINLVVVDIPEGVERIGWGAFVSCTSLTSVLFPTMLTYIRIGAFRGCSSLENVDLLHTNLQELGSEAFTHCSELKSLTIPDSLQTFGSMVFFRSSNLVPSNIYAGDSNEVIAHLRSQQQT